MNQNTQPNIDARYRTMLTVWFGLFMSIGIYFAVSVFLAPQISKASETSPTRLFAVVLSAGGGLFVLLSFAVKRSGVERSGERQEVAVVLQAVVVAGAMCEVSALVGLVERFLFDSHEYYLLFLISAIGTALHFPRREQVLAATYKAPLKGATS